MKSKYESLGILIPSRERINFLEKLLYSLANSPDSNFLEVVVVSDDCPKTLKVIEEFPLQDKFFLDPKKIKNPKANEILEKLKQGFFEWPCELNIPF